MATGIQTGIRTGSAPLPTGKGPAGGGGGIGKVLAAWTGMSTKMKVLTVVIVCALVISAVGGFLYTSANKPVSLYATNLTPGDVQEIGRRLNEWNIAFTVEGGNKIMVNPGKRSQVVGMLLSYGLPHRALTSSIDAGGMAPKTESEKRQIALEQLQAQLVDQIRHFDPVADVYVNLVLSNEDELPQDRKPAKGAVFLTLKAGMQPKKEQIEAIQSLVAGSVNGLEPKNVAVTDSSGRKWTDDQGRIAMGGGSTGDSGSDPSEFGMNNEQLGIKRGFEAYYKRKVEEALDQVLGRDKYRVTVNAEFDFSQTQIKTTVVGDPSSNNQVVTVVKTDKEVYGNKPSAGKDDKGKQAKTQPVGPSIAGKASDETSYVKYKYETKTETGKSERTAVIPPGVVKRKTIAVAVDGKQDPSFLDAVKKLSANAVGIDEAQGDKVDVVAMAFNRDPVAVNPGAMDPGMMPMRPRDNSTPKGLLLVGMLVPTCILLTILAIFLLRQRKVQADKTGLILSTTPGTTTSDISDLLTDKIGRSTATTQTTRANNTEQLEKLAKEKPTKVAELLKSTWLSDKDR